MTIALNPADRDALLAPLLANGWHMETVRDAITKRLKFKNFSQAWGAMSRISLACEVLDHHPEWSNVYNRLEITLTTHSCAGLSMLDVTLAQKIDTITHEATTM